MDKEQAKQLIKDTFEASFNKEQFIIFIKNLLNNIKESTFLYRGNLIPDAFEKYISTLERIGKYKDDKKEIDILIVKLKKKESLERARPMLRNFIAWYLNGSRGGKLKDAALVAFVSPDEDDWRFSLVKMDYRFEKKEEKIKVKEEFTPARRWSFLVGKNEKSHTAQSRFVPILEDDEHNPSLDDLEKAFNIETVTKEFFEKYRDLFIRTVDELDKIVEKNEKVKKDFESKNINTVDFAKKLLGQIVFLYFLQKKGWFGVKRDAEWGKGSKNFLRELFEEKHGKYQNFFNDILEPLFYEALAKERDDNFYSRFDCKIPFLNGGLFEPIGNYDWVNADIPIPNELFSNNNGTKEGDIGDGILDVFDRFNFTVKEDEPLEKEVAIDPELLGKLYEKFNAITPDNFKEYKKALSSGKKELEKKFNKQYGVYYTPREIVHYMCQQSLINYLATELEGKVSKDDIETFILYGEQVRENEATVINKGRETDTYKHKLPESIRNYAKEIDKKLANITVCDPAVGSGAFPVGMMHEIVKSRLMLSTYIEPDKSSYHFKRKCIEKSLYGVDIDPGAVEIAKLRLWLSLVVDEEDIRQIKPLPNLDYKIMCGNSLLGVEENLFNIGLFDELEKLKPLYFNETIASKKQEYKIQIDNLISQITNGHKEFDFEVYFSEVFHEKKGFDIVIANPPYVDYRDISKEVLNAVSHYRTNVNSHRPNLFMYFIEKGFYILRPKGYFAFINPNQFLSINAGLGLRKFIFEHTTIKFIIDVSYIKVFQEAATYTAIWLFVKNSNPDYKIRINACSDLNKLGGTTFYVSKKEILNDPMLIIPISQEFKLLSKIEGNHPKLGTICNMIWGTSRSGYGKQKISKFQYLKLNNKERSKYKPILQTSDIKRYYIEWQGEYIPYQIYSDKVKSIFKQEEKILIARVTRALQCAIDDKKRYVGKSSVIFNCKIKKGYLLAILNSTLINYWYSKKFETVHMASGYLRFDIPYLQQIPIAKADEKTDNMISEVVNKILAITKDDDYLENSSKQAKVHEYERQIDQLVYKLYDLTEEEIKIVEG